jgi:hypothetical protein
MVRKNALRAVANNWMTCELRRSMAVDPLRIRACKSLILIIFVALDIAR